jgi:hypothetical protein
VDFGTYYLYTFLSTAPGNVDINAVQDGCNSVSVPSPFNIQIGVGTLTLLPTGLQLLYLCKASAPFPVLLFVLNYSQCRASHPVVVRSSFVSSSEDAIQIPSADALK